MLPEIYHYNTMFCWKKVLNSFYSYCQFHRRRKGGAEGAEALIIMYSLPTTYITSINAMQGVKHYTCTCCPFVLNRHLFSKYFLGELAYQTPVCFTYILVAPPDPLRWPRETLAFRFCRAEFCAFRVEYANRISLFRIFHFPFCSSHVPCPILCAHVNKL